MKRYVLPVIVLADCSGSMEGEKIAVLHECLIQLVDELKKYKPLYPDVDMKVGVIGFGGETAEQLVPLASVDTVSLSADLLEARGRTPMGAAIKAATNELQSAYSDDDPTLPPVLLLISDGRPTDGDAWRSALDRLQASPVGALALRFSVSIGEDAIADDANQPLRGFASDGQATALDIRNLPRYFEFITKTVTNVARSQIVSKDDIQPYDG